MKQSAGTLLYRRTPRGLEVLLVHASGNYNKKAAWSIPKGKPDPGEELEQAARRETLEETGVVAPESLTPFGSIVYTKSRKQIHCFAGEVPITVEASPASWEVDQAEFLPLEEARKKIHPDQKAFLDRLAEVVPKP
ncbi:MAG: NUDIX domain-containing protein [Planctomycetota bacterium]|nr:NUDIX domain-containing protein [Planctomycetaceae bacterium]MDQ3332309.1 NUDIX domain-containing protein [Planctomycetota bacterium]